MRVAPGRPIGPPQVTTPSLTEGALAVGHRIGRYFGVVSMLPALFLVLWSAALIASGAWRGRPRLESLGAAFGQPTVAKVAWILVLSLATGLFLHPLQFAMTQVLEGYWGHSRIGRILTGMRIDRYRRKQRELENRRATIGDQLRELVDARLELVWGKEHFGSWDDATYELNRRRLLMSERG